MCNYDNVLRYGTDEGSLLGLVIALDFDVVGDDTCLIQPLFMTHWHTCISWPSNTLACSLSRTKQAMIHNS